jgi:SAM-dependent methyltransferase
MSQAANGVWFRLVRLPSPEYARYIAVVRLIQFAPPGAFGGRKPPMTDNVSDRNHWASFAREWIAWARAPDHDAFWAYRAALVDFIGRGRGKALDVGCGEGRVSRELKTLGYRVTASDPVAELLDAAREADSAHAYALAAGTDLPFGANHFDLVVAYNMLMDADDVPGVLREIRRVMQPGGTLMVSIVHPIADHARFAGPEPNADFVSAGTYFGRQRFDDAEKRNGLTMHFGGWSQPIEAYAAALEGAGLAITSLREPIPARLDVMPHMQRWTRFPLFLWLKARPLGFP